MINRSILCICLVALLLTIACDSVYFRPRLGNPDNFFGQRGSDALSQPDKIHEITKTDTIKEIHHYPDKDSNTKKNDKATDPGDPTKTTVYFNITAEYPEGDIIPERIMLDRAEVRSGDLVANGQRNLIIEKFGYERIEQMITIPQVVEHKISRELMTKPRLIRFDITDAKTHAKITPDEVLVSSRRILDNALLKPSYIRSLEIHKAGYESVISSISLEPGEDVYVLRHELNPITEENPTILKWNIETDYPEGMVLESFDRVLVDGKPVEPESAIAPGEHTIEIRNAGFAPLTEKITVPKGMPVYVFKGKMNSLPRLMLVDIICDIPSADQAVPKVELKAIGGGIRAFRSGEQVKPGEYELSIEKPGYLEYREKRRIYPGVTPYTVKVQLESRPVVVDAQVDFDIAPPATLEPHVISFTPRDTGIAQKVRPGGSIKPGRYSYAVEKPGYAMKGEPKEITIEAGDKTFMIRADMVALPRTISINAVDQRKEIMVAIEDVIINNQKFKYSDKFQPGQKYHIIVKFKEYDTVEQDIFIEPGHGPYILNIPLTRK